MVNYWGGPNEKNITKSNSKKLPSQFSTFNVTGSNFNETGSTFNETGSAMTDAEEVED